MFKTKREKLAYAKGVRKGKGMVGNKKSTYSNYPQSYRDGVSDFYLQEVNTARINKDKEYRLAVLTREENERAKIVNRRSVLDKYENKIKSLEDKLNLKK